MNPDNITSEERALCAEIISEGKRKYDEQLGLLYELAGITDKSDPLHRELEGRLGDIFVWLARNFLDRRSDFEREGIKASFVGADYGQYRYGNICLDGEHISISWQYFRDYHPENRISVHRPPYTGTYPADKAMQVVTEALKWLSQWQDIVARYNRLRNTVDNHERDESRDRVAKYRHQLELLKKL